jgi:hypothetical protein
MSSPPEVVTSGDDRLTWSLPPTDPALLSKPTFVLVPVKRRKREKIVVAFAVVALAGVGVSGWLVARQQSSVAAGWRRSDVAQVSTNRVLSSTLVAARSSITRLNGRVTLTDAQLVTARSSITKLGGQVHNLTAQVTTLDGTITGLQGQLSTVGTQKEKALDQNAALTQLLSAAGAVSTALQTCVQGTDSFMNQLVDDIDDGTVLDDPTLTSNADNVDDVCSAAETANQQLQAAISGETGS